MRENSTRLPQHGRPSLHRRHCLRCFAALRSFGAAVACAVTQLAARLHHAELHIKLNVNSPPFKSLICTTQKNKIMEHIMPRRLPPRLPAIRCASFFKYRFHQYFELYLLGFFALQAELLMPFCLIFISFASSSPCSPRHVTFSTRGTRLPKAAHLAVRVPVEAGRAPQRP